MVGSYWNSANLSCTSCMSYCLLCTNSSACQACALGWAYSSQQSICMQCPANCQNCTVAATTTTTTCLDCTDGYFITASGQCQVCPNTCLLCISQSICTQCVNGNYLSNSTCQPCPTNCLTCTDANTCTSCSVGYYPSSGVCQPCVNNCTSCTSPTFC